MKVTIEMDENDFIEFLNYKNDKKYILNNLQIIIDRYVNSFSCSNEMYRVIKSIYEDIEKLLFKKLEIKNK